MNFNDNEYNAAKSVNLINYLLSNGVELVRHTANSVRMKEHDSLIIRDDNRWFWNSRQQKGNNAISFLMTYCSEENFKGIDGKNMVEVIKELASFNGISFSENLLSKDNKKPFSKESVEFKLPEAARDNRRAIAYLAKTRHIDYEVINHCIKHKKLYQDTRGNCVFVGTDENGTPKFANKRGTYDTAERKPYKKDALGSDKKYGFCFGEKSESKTVYVFESAIDAMSHATLTKMYYGDKWRDNYRLSLDGLCEDALDVFLAKHPKVNRVVLALDNDKAGRDNTYGVVDEETGLVKMRSLKNKYEVDGYKVLVHTPKNSKDFNEMLCKICERNSIICEPEIG